MFGRKKAPPPRRTGGGRDLMAQMGFMTDMDDMVMNSPDDEEALEAELRALQGEDEEGFEEDLRENKRKDKKRTPGDLDQMITLSMKEDDVEVSDTEDPEIMAELGDLLSTDDDHEPQKPSLSPNFPSSPSSSSSSSANSSPLDQLLQDRLAMYKIAIENAKKNGESSKKRRYERGLGTLSDLIKDLKAGKQINQEEIPPPIALTTQKPTKPLPQEPSQPSQTHPQPSPRQPSPPKPFPSHSSPQSPRAKDPSKQEDLKKYTEQRDLFKKEAIEKKKEGANDKAVLYLRFSKQFDILIGHLLKGEEFEISQVPPFFGTPQAENVSKPASPSNSQKETEDLQSSEVNTPEMSEEDKKKLYNVPKELEGGGSLMENLMLRFSKYKEAHDQAIKENNGSKARRLNRILKQYQDAIRKCKSNKPYDFSELPCPPGFPPLPISGRGNAPSVAIPASLPDSPSADRGFPQKPDSSSSPPSGPSPQKSSGKTSIQRQSSAFSRTEQQAQFLEKRQFQFKKAAIEAKNSGDMELAKKYMKFAKGFDRMIEASRAGLPVDLSQIPTPPGDEGNFNLISSQDAPTVMEGDSKEQYQKLQEDLLQQIKLAETNRDTFTKLGDISAATKFERMGENSKKDLESLKNAFDHGDPVPRFHYETRQFSIVQCNPELGDNDIEVSIMRGINYNPPSGYSPSDMTTYVTYEFPFPDTPQTGYTDTVKSSVSPEYAHTFRLEGNRKSRSFLRLLKSNKTFKFDVYYKRGFFKSDKILGSVQFKLLPLENSCNYHDAFDLMDGRRAVGGKLEVQIKIRDPFINKQVEERKEKWLVIDEFLRNSAPRKPPSPISRKSPNSKTPHSSSSSSSSFQCMSVLLFDRDHLEEQIAKYQSKLTPEKLQVLKQKSIQIQQQANQIKLQLHKGGAQAIKTYIGNLKQLCKKYENDMKGMGSESHEKMKLVMTRRTLVLKEIQSLTRKLDSEG